MTSQIAAAIARDSKQSLKRQRCQCKSARRWDFAVETVVSTAIVCVVWWVLGLLWEAYGR